MVAQIPNVMARLRRMTEAEAAELARYIEEIQFWLDELPSINEEEEAEEQILRWERMKEIDRMTVPRVQALYVLKYGVDREVVQAYYDAAKCYLKDQNCIFPEDWLGEDPQWRVPHPSD